MADTDKTEYEVKASGGRHEVYHKGKLIGSCEHSFEADGIIKRHIGGGQVSFVKVILKRAVIIAMVSPLLFLAYHKGMAEYVEFLWPNSSTNMQGFTAFFSLVGAFASGLYISFNWKS